ncbi:Bcr/CflA family efflux MFS transporter [Staphylococcus canis]|uniref:Bcr/CflA family efflux transporter n=1 Tax=Staphylococcus canis TaxID=2724942 RepID=A0ABS0T6X3_9STAP|nr:Bcr/CflA family efflux MFS transporter [Staphylococcus canis]MBI5974484.1 multidrug effflux MFS transporter [Staphylococcus canis]
MQNAQTPSRFTSLLFIIILGTMTAFGPLLSDMYSPALPLVQEDFGITTSKAQITLSIAMIGIAIGQFVFGVIADRISRQKLGLFILMIVIIASIISALATNVELFILIRFIQGIAGGGAIVLARATIGELYEGEKLSHFFTALMVVNGIVSVIAPLLSGLILGVSVWRTIFWVLSFIGVVLFIALLIHPQMRTLTTTHEQRKSFKAIFKDFGHLLKTPRFVVPMLLQGVTYIMIFSYGAGAPFIVQNIYGLNPQSFSLLMVVTSIGLIVTSQLSNLLLRIWNQIRVLSLFVCIQAFGALFVIIVLTLHLPLAVLIFGFILCVTPVTAVGPLAFSLAMQSRTGGSGSASSLLGLFQFALGSSIAPLIGIQGAESVVPYTVILGLTLILLLLLLMSVKRLRIHS